MREMSVTEAADIPRLNDLKAELVGAMHRGGIYRRPSAPLG
jgi:hypothetical protein